MKKNYIAPASKIYKMQMQDLMAASGNGTVTTTGLDDFDGFGGSDDTKDPASKGSSFGDDDNNSVWDD
ncbi:hypothetical protein [Prevotella sp. AGR2160]|uniref:hypothetical protein n=1 Tax=Prevotella sp. AGR2160 TaxID=1280674 RepID=UPI00048D629C|nr:hypothetical protein [Prevotella sp. AGR2160]